LFKLHVKTYVGLSLLAVELKIPLKTSTKLLPYIICLREEGYDLLVEDLFPHPVFFASEKLFFNFSFQNFFE
jgi:hypothetical protein